MKQTKVLTILLASMPTYLSFYCPPVYAVVIMSFATLIGVIMTANLDDDKDMIEKLRTSWIIHLIGICVSVTIHNIL
jgi:hypothetical protein